MLAIFHSNTLLLGEKMSKEPSAVCDSSSSSAPCIWVWCCGGPDPYGEPLAICITILSNLQMCSAAESFVFYIIWYFKWSLKYYSYRAFINAKFLSGTTYWYLQAGWGCHNQVYQSNLVASDNRDFLTIPEARNRKPRYHRAKFFPQTLWLSQFHAFFLVSGLPGILGICWLIDTSF